MVQTSTTFPESVRFLPSQLGRTSQTPVAYTGNPLTLLWSDFRLICRVWTTVPGIMWPMRLGKHAEVWDELYPSARNLFALILHLLLVPLQTAFLFSIPVLVGLQIPALWILAYIASFITLNTAVCRLVNGNKLVLEPSRNIVFPPRDDEYWIYLNGVSVGRDWLQSNIDRLSLTFGRRVVGVHNPTDGIIFDLIQCLVQRNFCYSTEDIRAAYGAIKAALLRPRVKKVIFLLHSQGGIEGGLIIDWLLTELPHDACGKLEVYTFGNAANHFNNPVRSDGGSDSDASSPPAHKPGRRRRAHAIRHIEHYANASDFVSQFGVLNYSAVSNRFMGRVFVAPASGHLLNQHYLRQMFALDPDDACRCADANAFMDMDVDVDGDAGGDGGAAAGRESVARSLTSTPAAGAGAGAGAPRKVALVSDADSPVSPVKRSWSLVGDATHPGRRLKVKDFSRLWQYRNGGAPPEDHDDVERVSGAAGYGVGLN